MAVLYLKRALPPEPFPDPEGVLGDVITWDNKEWLVCHIDYDQNVMYLISKDCVHDKTQITGIYCTDQRYQYATEYQDTQMSADALSRCIDVTVPGQGDRYDATAKVFVPTHAQMNGGFSWFYNTTNRIAQYQGSNVAYWTSTNPRGSSGINVAGADYIRAVGDFYSGSTNDDKYWIRVAVAVKCKKPILPNPPVIAPPSSHTPGDVITWDEKEWLVCHYDSSKNQVYLISNDIISTNRFSNGIYYYKSDLAAMAASYYVNNMSTAAILQCVDVTVPVQQELGYNITAKVFVPTKEQMDGGFSWFTTDANRKAKYNGVVTSYWTSTTATSSTVYYIDNSGGINNRAQTNKYGFRPCICVQL